MAITQDDAYLSWQPTEQVRYQFTVAGVTPTSLTIHDRQVFAPPPPSQPEHGPILMEEQQAQRMEKGHGRLEVWKIRVSSELAE